MQIRLDLVGLSMALAATAALLAAPVNAQEDRPDRIDGRPNLNGNWQALNTAHWDLEAHSAAPLDDFWQLGAIGAIPAGQSVVVGGTIPYLPEALAEREEHRAGWPASDPEAKCYMPGIPRATYMPYPFQIIQGDGDILFAYAFASANRPVHMTDIRTLNDVPVDMWMGWSNGRWDGDTLVVEVIANDDRTWFDRAGNHHSNALTVTERYSLIDENHIQYEATIDDANTFSRPWTISMPLYRIVKPNAELLDFKCVEFSENLLYSEFLKEPPTQLH
ncbi:hypothetical protein [Candidatus Rariloculus sp.]|uniref:hypothetical protein n=1 Tax=Candidatus Rariloculus sp. TaxID=3101265 RepID=UPI003D116E76